MANIKTLDELQQFISKNHTSTAKSFQYYAEQGAKLKPLKKLFGNYILDGALVHFPAKRGSGKSLLCMQICLAISHRYDEFLGEIIEKHGKTLYLDFEMSESITQRRAHRLKQSAAIYKKEFADDLVIFNSRKSFIEEFNTINQLLYQLKPVLIVVDNLRNALRNVNTNSAVDMANFFSILNALKEIHNFSIVIIDHFKKHTNGLKSDSDLQSGSGVKTDLSDADFLLRNSSQDKNLRLLKRMKSRLAEESDNTKLIALNPETLWFELISDSVIESEHIGLSDIQDKDEQKDIALKLKDDGKSLEEIAQILGKGKTTIHRWTK